MMIERFSFWKIHIYLHFNTDRHARLESKLQVIIVNGYLLQQFLHQRIIKLRDLTRLRLYEFLKLVNAFRVFLLRSVVHAFLLLQLTQAQDFLCDVIVVLPALRPVDQLPLQFSHFC